MDDLRNFQAPYAKNRKKLGVADSERVNSGAVSAELIGMLALTVLLLVVGFIRGDMVTGWHDEHSLDVTSPQGRLQVDARAIILATGARERPRPARLIPGDRPAGVYTTGQLQNLVHLHHRAVGRRAVVVGAELVSWSAVLTLKHAGCRTALMTTTYPSPESYGVFNIAGKSPLMTR